MKDQTMKNLIVDNNMLVYLHDLLSYRENCESFYQLDVYETLNERHLTTVVLGLRKTTFTAISFFITIQILKSLTLNPILLLMVSLFVSIFYGIMVIASKKELKDLSYQFQLKKAAQFALENYCYDEYVVFLDKYLSEQSTRLYFQQQGI
jgi:hypothetical protein